MRGTLHTIWCLVEFIYKIIFLTYPLKSCSVMVSPNKFKKFLKAALSSLLPNNSSSWVYRIHRPISGGQ